MDYHYSFVFYIAINWLISNNSFFFFGFSEFVRWSIWFFLHAKIEERCNPVLEQKIR